MKLFIEMPFVRYVKYYSNKEWLTCRNKAGPLSKRKEPGDTLNPANFVMATVSNDVLNVFPQDSIPHASMVTSPSELYKKYGSIILFNER